MPTKRSIAKAEAAKNVDLAERLGPFFPLPAADLMARADERSLAEPDS